MLQGKMFQVSEQMIHPENSEKQDVVKNFVTQSRSEVMLAVERLSDCLSFGAPIMNSQILGIEGGM